MLGLNWEGAVNLVRKYLYFTDWLNAKFAWIVAFLIVSMLCIMIWEIVLRYFFNAPSLWAYEISLFLYGVISRWAVPIPI